MLNKPSAVVRKLDGLCSTVTHLLDREEDHALWSVHCTYAGFDGVALVRVTGASANLPLPTTLYRKGRRMALRKLHKAVNSNVLALLAVIVPM